MEVTRIYDVAVIGGGPAGTSAAITASRLGHSVLLLDAGSFPRQKVCGEFVSSESLALLKQLLPDAHRWEQSAAITRARIFLGGKVRELPVRPSAQSISRYEMDAALWRAAAEVGTTALAGSRVLEVSGGDPFRIITSQQSFAARTVINASGRWSNLHQHARRPDLNASLGLKQHFREENAPQSVDLYFFYGGYCGVQPLSDDTINVAAMVSPQIAKTLDSVFHLNSDLAKRSADWKPIGDSVATFPLSFGDLAPVQTAQNILNVGDAAGFIDPFVGDGISMALHSGRMAAECLSAHLCGHLSLFESAIDYRKQFEENLSPAYCNAARIRGMFEQRLLRKVALELIRVPALADLAVRSTRARTA